MKIAENISLRSYNTFGIDARARYLCEVTTQEELLGVLSQRDKFGHRFQILGGGSNVLFASDFNGLVALMRIRGRAVQHINGDVLVTAAAGESWPEFVDWCVSQGWGGLENLSLIPGTVGASPIQNVGAYGVELKDCFYSLTALNLNSLAEETFDREACRFSYRNSIFKQELKDRYIILAVTFRLNKNPVVNCTYPALKEIFAHHELTPGINEVAAAVKKIRLSKLPDPALLGNAGSFFKNPFIEKHNLDQLRERYPSIPFFETGDSACKLSAAWLIDHCGLKGFRIGGAAVHEKQPLVLVNQGSATVHDLLALSEYVKQRVYDAYGVKLEEEVNIIR